MSNTSASSSPSWPAQAGLRIGGARVARQWTDHNGHMNLASYLFLFDRCFARFCDRAGIGPKQISKTGRSIFVAETHLVYQRELSMGEPVDVGLRVLELGARKMRTYMTMLHRDSGELVCVNEKLDICVDMTTRNATTFPENVRQLLDRLHAREGDLPPPEFAARRVQMLSHQN